MEGDLRLEQNTITRSKERRIDQVDWQGCDLVVEASGQFRTSESLDLYANNGVNKVVVTAPVYADGIANIVVGVNEDQYDLSEHKVVTAASCTTNCIAPVIKVIDAEFGIRHGSLTTIHALTNTQTILDAPHKDLRRARACGTSLIPTTTGSARAITEIFPHLAGRLNGHAVRAPLASPSLTDLVFELSRPTTAEVVNEALSAAAKDNKVLGFESRPLVSIDYKSDPRSAVIDGPSTMVVNGTQLKLYAWYDNEWGYANRTVELALLAGGQSPQRDTN